MSFQIDNLKSSVSSSISYSAINRRLYAIYRHLPEAVALPKIIKNLWVSSFIVKNKLLPSYLEVPVLNYMCRLLVNEL